MNLAELKSWLDGFSEAIGDAPTPEQWVKVKEKIYATESQFATSPINIASPALPSYPIYHPTNVWPFTVTSSVRSNTFGAN